MESSVAFSKLQQVCRHTAMDLLARREHSVKELQTKLQQRKQRLLNKALALLESHELHESREFHKKPQPLKATPLIDSTSVYAEEPIAVSDSVAVSSSGTKQSEKGAGPGAATDKATMESFFDDALQTALEALQSESLLCDLRFAEAYLRMRANAGIGPEKIKSELFQRGINNTNWIDEAREWQEDLKRVVQKKTKGRKSQNASELASLQRFLRYRGFPGHMLVQALRSYEEPA